MSYLFKGLLIASAVVFMSACGQDNASNAFKNVSISKVDQNGNAVVTLRTEVGSENVIFQAATLPIVDPKTGKEYGTISMERTLDGKNILVLNANVTGIHLGNYLADNKLPNGTNVPVAGLSRLIAVQAGKSSRVYLGTNASADTWVLGLAVAVKEFDSLGNQLPGTAVFFNLDQNAGAKGLGGFFTSTESGKSGLAIFVQTDALLDLPKSGISSKALASTSTQKLKFVERRATREQANYFGYFLERWKRLKTRLKVQ